MVIVGTRIKAPDFSRIESMRALENGVERFMPGGETLRTWVVIQHAAVADDPVLRDWLDAGLRAIS